MASIEVEYPQPYSFIDFDAEKELREENPIDDNFIKAINEFSYKTSTNILTDTGENINYSPLSLYFALSLAPQEQKEKLKNNYLLFWVFQIRSFFLSSAETFIECTTKIMRLESLK